MLIGRWMGRGRLTALAAASWATACGGGTSGPSPAPPPPPPAPVVTTVAVTPLAATVFTGDTLQLKATIQDQHGAELSGKSVTWSSSDLARATVSTSGLVSGVAEGTVRITATVDSKSGSASLEIRKAALAGAAGTPVAASIQRIPFVARAEDYTDTHPELPGFFVSHNTLMLSFAAGVNTRQANAVLDSLGATIVGGIPGVPGSALGILFLRVPTQSHAEMIQLLAGLQADSRVAHAVQDALLGPDRTSKDNNFTAAEWTWELTPTGNNWGLELSRVPQMWNLNPAIEKERSRTGILPPVTSIFDVGFADSHRDLDYQNLTPGNSDDHGTHVAGIIGAKFDDGFGIDGVNPFARMQVRSISNWPSGGTLIQRKASAGQAILSALDSLLLAQPGIRVLNLSLGYNWSSFFINTDNEAPARQLASDQGALFVDMLRAIEASGGTLPVIVAAAGNDSESGVQQAKYSSPMAAAGLLHGAAAVIVVEAIRLSAGSSGGATRNETSNVNGHVSAPGKDILSTVPGDAFGIRSGTSMAAPHVAGLVGYLYALLPVFPKPTLAENKARDLITANAVAVAGGARPRMDAFATILDADRVLGGDAVLRKLLDIDDGSADGNRRDVELAEDFDGDLGTGDGRIDMSDFRRWRDWLLQVEDPAVLALDGTASNLKKDVNADGRIWTPFQENVYPRGDFNGDGTLSRTAVRRVPGAMGGQNVTDLQVLQRLFSDPNYLALDLPGLLNSADLRIEASPCLLLPGVVRVQSAIRVAGTDTSVQSRVHDNEPEQVYTAPVLTSGYTASATAKDVSGAVIGFSEKFFGFQLGSDASWNPTCPPPPCPSPVLGSAEPMNSRTANVCQPPPPPPPPSNCTSSFRIDSDARFAAASGVTCASNMSIGGFNNSLTVLVSFPELTQITQAFAVRAEVPGGLSLPALKTLGNALFEMAKLATLDLPALTGSAVDDILVRGAADLTTIKFGALQTLKGLGIWNNPKLTDISGIACGARINGPLSITDNPELSTAAAQALANCLIVTGTVRIENNKVP